MVNKFNKVVLKNSIPKSYIVISDFPELCGGEAGPDMELDGFHHGLD